jgi:hypothetical protein
MKQGRQAYKFYGVSVFGFVVDPVTARAVAFGADPFSLAMRNSSNAFNLQGQLVDYGTLIHAEFMKTKGGEYLDTTKQSLVRRFNTAGNDHETLRTILKDIWLQNLST